MDLMGIGDRVGPAYWEVSLGRNDSGRAGVVRDYLNRLVLVQESRSASWFKGIIRDATDNDFEIVGENGAVQRVGYISLTGLMAPEGSFGRKEEVTLDTHATPRSDALGFSGADV